MNLLFLLIGLESTCPSLQHLHSFLKGHVDLIAHWNQTFGQMHVILLQQLNGDEYVVNVAEYQSPLFCVATLLFGKGHWVASPVSMGIQVMRSMVAIVERETIALYGISVRLRVLLNQATYWNINQCNTGEEVRVRILRIDEGMLAPVPHHETYSHDRQWED